MRYVIYKSFNKKASPTLFKKKQILQLSLISYYTYELWLFTVEAFLLNLHIKIEVEYVGDFCPWYALC